MMIWRICPVTGMARKNPELIFPRARNPLRLHLRILEGQWRPI
jgi:hypothetical protein